jgi:hypothetical protein
VTKRSLSLLAADPVVVGERVRQHDEPVTMSSSKISPLTPDGRLGTPEGPLDPLARSQQTTAVVPSDIGM